MDLLAFRSISFLCISHSAPFPTSPCICFYITDCFGWLASGRWELRKYTHNRPSGDFQRSLLQFVVHSSSSWKSSPSIPRSCTKVFCVAFSYFSLLLLLLLLKLLSKLLMMLLLLKLLYNICRMPGFEPKILRPPTGVLPHSNIHSLNLPYGIIPHIN